MDVILAKGFETRPSKLMICNAISAVEHPIWGVVAENGDVIYSRFRHDYRWSPDKSVMIDGGRDYTRWGASNEYGMDAVEHVKLIILDGVLKIAADQTKGDPNE